jgi:DNA-binding NarL/FixJ family response regulator
MASASIRLRTRRVCPISPPGRVLIPLGVLLVDDQPEFLDVAQAILAERADVMVIATASNGDEAVGLVRALAPDLVVLDVQLPDLSGFETARRMVACSPGLRVVMVSGDGEPGYEAFARSAGAEAFLTKKQFLRDGLNAVLDP